MGTSILGETLSFQTLWGIGVLGPKNTQKCDGIKVVVALYSRRDIIIKAYMG